MKTIKTILIGTLLMLQTQLIAENATFDKTNTIKKFSKEEGKQLSTSYHQASVWMKKLDLKKAEEEFDKILSIVPHNLYNDDYIFALMTKSKLYASFELLDKAEFSVLKACGLSDELANRVVNVCLLKSKDEAKSIVKELKKMIDKENYYGFHVVKGLIEQTFSLKEKDAEKYKKLREAVKQRRYDLTLYPTLLRYRVTKIKRNKRLVALQEYLKKEKKEKNRKELEDLIATAYVYLGKFDEASEIADKFLAKDKNDINSLYTKMNIAMSSGRYDEMKEYEKRILKIQPNAFK